MHAYDSRLVADTGIDVALVNGRTVRAASPLDIRALPKVNWTAPLFALPNEHRVQCRYVYPWWMCACFVSEVRAFA